MGTPGGTLVWRNGESGVDIFFVISGFVMAVTLPGLAKFEHKAWVFLQRRLVRIVPLYWIFTTLRLLRLEYAPPVGEQSAGSLWHIIASYLFIPAAGANGSVGPLLTVGWTLNYEMLFYLLFALALALEIRPLVFLLPTLGALALVGWHDHPSWPAVTTLASPIVLEFLFGVVLAHFALQGRLPSARMGILLFLAGFAAIVMIPPNSLPRSVFWGLPAAAIVTGAVAAEGAVGKGLPRWLLELGNASYAIYLVHLFVVSVCWLALLRLHQTGTVALVEMIVLGVAGSAAAGVVVHRLIELPLMQRMRGKRVRGVDVLPAESAQTDRSR